MIAAIIFDLDGTLVDTESMHFEGFAAVLAELGVRVEREDYFRRLIHFTDRECFELILREHALQGGSQQIGELVARKAARYMKLLDGADLLYPAAYRFVQHCAQRFPLALATGTLREEANLVLQRIGLRDLFRVIISADDVTRGKPDPQPFLLALAGLNETLRVQPRLAPNQCLVVEDTAAGVQAARAAGMKVLGIAHTCPAAALADADVVRPSLAEADLEQVLGQLPD